MNADNILKFPKANWIMPFLFTYSSIYIDILKEVLQDNFAKITSVYGSSQCLWAGGRPMPFQIKNLPLIEKTISNLIDLNITPAFTFSNIELNMEDLKNPYCNDLLKIISDTNSRIIIASDLLYDYIKDKYPNIKITASVIKFFLQEIKNVEEETQYINTLIDKYDNVVIRSEYFKDGYENIKKYVKDISKLVILVNSTCANYCKNAKKHYQEISKFNKNEITYDEGFNSFLKYCPKVLNPFSPKNTLSDKEIEKALDLGITNVKLQGRQVEFHEMTLILLRNLFNKKVNEKELRIKIDKICAEKIQKSVELQMYALIKNK